MHLDPTQVAAFQERGFLILERVFGPEEIAVLLEALPKALDASPERDYEGDGKTIRMGHGMHMYHSVFDVMSRHPRLVNPVGQLLGNDLYIYQSRLNIKAPFRGEKIEGYPWHQDYSTWHFRDGLVHPDLVVAITFLDEVNPCNAPLMLLPGSHRHGLSKDGAEQEQREMVIIPPEILAQYAQQNGIEAAVGPAGTVVLMHANTMHASGDNIAPLRRCTYTTVYAQPGNYPTRVAASAQLAPRTYPAIQTASDDCLQAVATP